jgi:hypothetical protein
MKTIKDLTVKVTYTVSLGGVNVSDEISEQLESIQGNGSVSLHDSLGNTKALEWIFDNIHEEDAYDWECKIIDLKKENEQ